jgi:penicillin V acylase-like amidase (Ntn superfamily)
MGANRSLAGPKKAAIRDDRMTKRPDKLAFPLLPSRAVNATLLIALVVTAVVAPAMACTRILWNQPGTPVLIGRTMDWPTSTDPVLTVLPRGLPHDGGKLGHTTVTTDNPLRWKSRYGSLVTTVYGIGTADGLNERGLSAHMLYLTSTDFGPRDPSKPALQAGLWAQYVLDNAASVTEALKLLEDVQLVMVEARGSKATVHLALEDASGDSAIIEYIGGKQKVHHGHEYRIMTNDPPYDEQLALLKDHDFSQPSSDMPLPGNVNPRDRFARATYFLNMMPAPKTEREGVAGLFAIARNVSVPFGAPYRNFGIYNTEYRTVTDDTNKRYFFELTTSPNVIWMELGKFDLRPGASVMTLHPDDINLSGDVSTKFKKSAAPF